MTHRSAWVFQHPKEVARVGEKKAAWNVGWHEPDGKRRQQSFGPGSNGKKDAFRMKKQIEAELLTGTYVIKRSVSWGRFREELRDDVFSSMGDENARIYENALEHFQRITKPRNVASIGVKKIDQYISVRSGEQGRKKGSKVSPATINKELRCLKSAFNYAHEWGYLPIKPSFKKRWIREPEKLPCFVTDEDFTKIYDACKVAERPMIPNVSPAVWWQALLIMAYMTGWRIDELLSFKRKDLDLVEGTAITRHKDNKGKRDALISIHDMVIDHIKKIHSFDEFVFPWPLARRQLYDQFHAIQEAAEIYLDCDEDHEHNDSCHHYGFHDIRRAFATGNAGTLSSEELQGLMRHQSYTTTKKYINMAKQLRSDISQKLKIPTLNEKTS